MEVLRGGQESPRIFISSLQYVCCESPGQRASPGRTLPAQLKPSATRLVINLTLIRRHAMSSRETSGLRPRSAFQTRTMRCFVHPSLMSTMVARKVRGRAKQGR